MKKKNILTTLFSGLTALTLLFVSACKPNETQPPEMVARVDEGKLGYLFTEYEGYYYEDASVLEEDDRVIISYTTNATKNTQDSVIAVRTGVKTADGYSFNAEESVAITPSESGWDRRNVGGSDLISGKFTYENTEYKYLMAYHANRIPSRKRLQIGLAVSNDLTSYIGLWNRAQSRLSGHIGHKANKAAISDTKQAKRPYRAQSGRSEPLG